MKSYNIHIPLSHSQIHSYPFPKNTFYRTLKIVYMSFQIKFSMPNTPPTIHKSFFYSQQSSHPP